MKQYFKIYRLQNGDEREKVNESVMRKIKDGWFIKQMECLPASNEGTSNGICFATSLVILFEKPDETDNEYGRD